MLSKNSKMFYFSGIGLCVNLKNGRMLCYRGFRSDDNIESRRVFTKMTDCNAVLDIEFWGLVDISKLKIKSIAAEITFPKKETHKHSVDEFSISDSDTYLELRAYIERCVSNGMGHQNTFIQAMKFAREVLVPRTEKVIGAKINKSDTRFFPTRRTVYTY